MDYRVTVTVPVDQAATASAVGRAMDTDVGGADSFIETDGVLTAQTWASEAFASMFQYLIASPQGLYMAILADYESRWTGLEPPTLEAVQAFCAAATLEVQHAGVPIYEELQ